MTSTELLCDISEPLQEIPFRTFFPDQEALTRDGATTGDRSHSKEQVLLRTEY